LDKRTVLKNDCLMVEISTEGAELRSIKDSDNCERLWQRDEKWWNGQAPLLFPVCGCMNEQKYLHKGKTYTIPPHGFARRKVFTLESSTNTKAVYLLESDSETLSVYPFEFELRVIYKLDKNRLSVTYAIRNKTDGEMYFSIGSHEAFSFEGNITDYRLDFEKAEPLVNHLLDGPLLNGKTEPKETENGALSMNDEEFKALDTLIFVNTESKKVTFRGVNPGRSVSVEFPGTDNLLIWKEPYAEFLCIEPWCGLPDYVGEPRELSEKPAINKLEKNGVFEKTHTIIID